MGVEVIINASLQEKLRGVIDDDVKLFAHNEFYSQMEPYVPADTLTMYDTAQVTAEGIRFVAPYSSFPYYGITRLGKPMNYKTDKHPLATDYWGEAAWLAKGDAIAQAVENFIRARSGVHG